MGLGMIFSFMRKWSQFSQNKVGTMTRRMCGWVGELLYRKVCDWLIGGFLFATEIGRGGS